MEYNKLFFDMINYNNEFININKNINGIEKIKININENYLTTFFNKLYLKHYRKDYKHIANDIYKLSNDNDEILLNEMTNIFNKYNIPIFLYSSLGISFSKDTTKQTHLSKILLYYSGGYIFLLSNDKFFKIKKYTGYKSADNSLKYNIIKKINGYKRADDIIKNNYPAENINYKTITTNELYFFIKQKNITNCPICNDEIIYENYCPYCLYQFSIDRINNKEIHHINNIQITCYNCNAQKGNLNINNNRYKIYNCCCKKDCYNKCHLEDKQKNKEIINNIPVEHKEKYDELKKKYDYNTKY